MHKNKDKGRPPRRQMAAPARQHSPGKPESRKPARGNRKPSAARQAGLEGEGARIAKVIARAGLCSRREAEGWIDEGRVAVNGTPLSTPAVNVRQGDKITIDGKPLTQRTRTRLFLFHKPRGLVTTGRDPEGRPTVFDYLREHWPEGPRVISIGRLDINTEGLLLLTNDGGLARVLELPATGWLRRYRVRAKGETDQAILDRLREGLTVDGVRYAGIEASLDRIQGANSWLTVTLREGKNREIKRVLEHLGLQVNRLIRLSFGPFQLGEMAEGTVEEVRTRVLRDQLGPALAEAAGADFLSPLEVEREAAAGKAAESRPREGSTPANPPGRARNLRGSKPPERETAAKAQPKIKPPPRPRKHISVLRATEGSPPSPRKRVERRETADRAGRTIHVERLVTAAPANQRQEKRRSMHSGKGKPSAARGGAFAEEHGRGARQQKRKPPDNLRAQGPKGRPERGYPAPRGKGPRRPSAKP